MIRTDDPEYWKHKARALLLPTPLAELDEEGEPERRAALLQWLDLADRRDDLHDEAARDAEGVHVPAGVRALRVATRAALDPDSIPMRALVHPLSGERPRDAADTIWRRDELRRRYQEWIEALRRDQDAPHDGPSYAKLWHEVHAATGPGRPASWIGQVPGDVDLRDHTWLAQRSMAASLVGARFGGSEACLLHVHCGPVQSFIAAARRTSDLWLGSYLVSLLTYQATRKIAELRGPDSVIFPHLATLPLAQRDLLPRHVLESRPRDEKQAWLRASQPNRFVAVVDRDQAEDIAAQAARAVLDRWLSMGKAVSDGLETMVDASGFASFTTQLAELLEIDVVAQPWPRDLGLLREMLVVADRIPKELPSPNAGSYYEAAFGLGRDTLAAQRRVISALPVRGDARVKCTQCGRREAMGPEGKGPRWADWWERLRVGVSRDRSGKRKQETVDFRRGEWLCAVCLTKRLACRYDLGSKEGSELGLDWEDKVNDRPLLRFPSVASIAAAPLRLYLLEQGAHLDVLRWAACVRTLHGIIEFDPPGNLLPGLGRIGRYEDVLDYDGTWLYARSYERETLLHDHDLLEEEIQSEEEVQNEDEGVVPAKSKLEKLDSELKAAREAFATLGKQMASAHGHSPGSSIRATSYYAVVVIDVDGMGSWLDGTHDDRPSLEEILEEAGAAAEVTQAPNKEKTHRPISSSLHAEVSRRQGELATTTLREIVEQRHLGRVVYSGGDDVLAFLPLHTVWCCLRDIEAAFRADDALGSKVTLSAGVAIFDWRSPLSLALRTAHRAEAKAKDTKGCVVVELEIRSGAPIELRLPWRFDDRDRGSCDLGDLTDMVEALVAASDPTSDDNGKTPALMRPSSVEILRRELDTLRHEGLEDAFKARIEKLVPVEGRCRAWLERMVRVRKKRSREEERRLRESGWRPDPAEVLERQPTTKRQGQQGGQVVEFLLLLRFLVRQHGGLMHQTLYDKIARRRAAMEGRR